MSTSTLIHDLRVIFGRFEREGVAASAVVIRDAIAFVEEASAREPMSPAVADIIAERNRQVGEEGWTAAHDDQHGHGEMALAAACYSLSSFTNVSNFGTSRSALQIRAAEAVAVTWPWNWSWWKPKNPRYDLVRAAALIVAEIDRLDRQAAKP